MLLVVERNRSQLCLLILPFRPLIFDDPHPETSLRAMITMMTQTLLASHGMLMAEIQYSRVLAIGTFDCLFRQSRPPYPEYIAGKCQCAKP